jgi:hypothetical protein
MSSEAGKGDLLGRGSVRMWWWPGPAEGELVPDHPPVELTDCIIDVQIALDAGDLPSWAERLALSLAKDEAWPEITLGDPDVEV